MRNWIQFIRERFNLWVYLPMILVFIVSHYVFYAYVVHETSLMKWFHFINFLPLFIVSVLFFFKLRLLDELKDYEYDRHVYAYRPLPRNLLVARDVFYVSLVIMIVEVTLFSFYGLWSFVGAVGVVGYSLLMYKEFFISDWLRPRLTLYAMSHTVIVVIFTLTVFVSLLHRPLVDLPSSLWFFAMTGWFLFNIFEFGRKSMSSKQESDEINTYSKIFGRYGSVVLVTSMVVLSILSVKSAVPDIELWPLLAFSTCLFVTGVAYSFFDTNLLAKIYRGMSSLYVLAFYIIFIYSL